MSARMPKSSKQKKSQLVLRKQQGRRSIFELSPLEMRLFMSGTQAEYYFEGSDPNPSGWWSGGTVTALVGADGSGHDRETTNGGSFTLNVGGTNGTSIPAGHYMLSFDLNVFDDASVNNLTADQIPGQLSVSASGASDSSLLNTSLANAGALADPALDPLDLNADLHNDIVHSDYTIWDYTFHFDVPVDKKDGESLALTFQVSSLDNSISPAAYWGVDNVVLGDAPEGSSCGCSTDDHAEGTSQTSGEGVQSSRSGNSIDTAEDISNSTSASLVGTDRGNNVVAHDQRSLVQVGSRVLLIDGGNKKRWFNDDGTGTLTGLFGLQDKIYHDTTNHEYRITGTDGSYTKYYDFDGSVASARRGKIKSFTDAKGNGTTYTYDGTTNKLTEISRSNTIGTVTTKEYFQYTYLTSPDVNAGKVSTITLKQKTWDTALSQSEGSVSYTTVRSTAYTYYGNSDSNGTLGDLKLIEIKDGSSNVIDTFYYRYYTSGSSIGYAGALKFALNPASYDRAVTALGSVLTATDNQLATYADRYYEYDSYRRVTTKTAQGEGCSTCTGGLGTYTYTYERSDKVPGYNSWRQKTTEVLPDGNQNVTYYNAYSQELLKIFQELDSSKSISSITHSGTTATVTSTGHGYSVNDVVVIRGASIATYNGVFTITGVTTNTFTYTMASNPGADPSLTSATARKVLKQWATFKKYDNQGREILIAQRSAVSLPSNITTLEQYADLLHLQSGNYQYLADSTGLIETTSYYDTTTADENTAGSANGWIYQTALQEGETGTSILQSQTDYFKHSNGGTGTNLAEIIVTADFTRYRNTDGSGAQTTSYDYSWFSSSLQMESLAITRPLVDGGQNGPNTDDIDTIFYDGYGREIWSKDADGFITYTAYDDATGGVTKRIVDVDTTQTSDFSNKPSGWTTPGGGGLHLTTTYQVDNLGRATKTTDPKGNVTFDVYNDASHERRTYFGWHASGTNYTTTGPVVVGRENRANSYYESLTFAYTPSGSSTPSGSESITASNIQSLSRRYISAGGQLDHRDNYFTLSGLSYTTGTNLGTLGTNFLRTTYAYQSRGQTKRVVAPDGTIRWTVYDGLNRLVSEWIGTNDTSATNSDPTGGGASGNNMLKIASYVYDAGGVGDSNLTQSKSVFGTNGADVYTTDYQYDFRNRMTDSRGPDNVATKYTLDNLGESTSIQTFADADVDFTIDSTELRDQTDQSFDEQNRVYQQTVYNVDPSTGTTGNSLTSNTWYNKRGMVLKVASANGLFSKSQYDGASRLTDSFTSFDTLDSTWGDADDVSGDTVIEQVKRLYDKAGNIITNISYSRLEDDNSTTGALGAATNQAWIQVGVNWYDTANRLTASAHYGRDDGATRYVFATNAAFIDAHDWTGGGSADGIPDEAQGTARSPNSSDDYIVGKFEYDDAGNAYKKTDNKGHITQNTFDLLGRKTKTIENYTNGSVAETETDTDRTTEWIYDSSGRLSKMRAWNPKGSGNGVEKQDTAYLYESAISGSFVTNTVYPDSTDNKVVTLTRSGSTATATLTGHGYSASDVIYISGADQSEYNGRFVISAVTSNTFSFTVSGTPTSPATGYITVVHIGNDQVKNVFDRLGRVSQTTDQNGTVHQFEYDSTGRFYADKITTLGTNIDGAVRRIERTYDDLSRTQYITSRSGTAAASSVVNEIKYTYDGWGNIIKSEQAQDSSVAAAGTNIVSVQYTYDDGGGLYVRLTKMTYPDGREVFYNYDSSGSIGDKLNRIDNIAADSSGTTKYAQYTYLGASTIVKVTHPAVTNGLVLSYGASGTYAGWDRFGRILKQEWKNDAGSTILDGSLYTYDRNGNRLTRDATSTSAPTNIDEQYTYDGLDRLNLFKRGTLASGSISGTNVAFTQDWGGGTNSAILDSLGNWQSWNDNGTSQTRTSNAVNETTGITGGSWNVPVYDAAGNMTSGPKGSAETTRIHFVYDAWNRMVATKNDSSGSPGSTIATYEYDGLGRRIEKTIGGHVYHGYYNEAWQYLETRVDSATTNAGQVIWDLRYIDAPILLGDGVGVDKYYTNDANMNVTAIVSQSTGAVTERYGYDAYGKVKFYTGNWGNTSSSAANNPFMFAGYTYDSESGTYHARSRYYHPTLGKWDMRDFAGYIDGGNLYGYVMQHPTAFTDPFGLDSPAPAPATSTAAPASGGGYLNPATGAQNGMMVAPAVDQWLDNNWDWYHQLARRLNDYRLNDIKSWPKQFQDDSEWFFDEGKYSPVERQLQEERERFYRQQEEDERREQEYWEQRQQEEAAHKKRGTTGESNRDDHEEGEARKRREQERARQRRFIGKPPEDNQPPSAPPDDLPPCPPGYTRYQVKIGEERPWDVWKNNDFKGVSYNEWLTVGFRGKRPSKFSPGEWICVPCTLA